MANRRKNSKEVPVASVTKLIGIAGLVALAGLFYVDLSNRTHRSGDDITKLEARLAELRTQNDVVRSKISQLASWTALQRRLSEGMISMVPITQDKIARVNAAASSFGGDEIRTVANEGSAP